MSIRYTLRNNVPQSRVDRENPKDPSTWDLKLLRKHELAETDVHNVVYRQHDGKIVDWAAAATQRAQEIYNSVVVLSDDLITLINQTKNYLSETKTIIDQGRTAAEEALAEALNATEIAKNSSQQAVQNAAEAKKYSDLSRDWATLMDGKVQENGADVDYSSKYYASQAASSASSASTSASTAAGKAYAAASSATYAANSASSAVQSRNEAAASATSAAQSATSANNAKNDAESAKETAVSKAGEASTSASNAANSASAAADSEAKASADTGVATAKAQEAKASATNAAQSETNALSYKNTAEQSATIATTKAAAAKSSENRAARYAADTQSFSTNSASFADISKKWAEDTSSPDGILDSDSPTGKTQSSKMWAYYSKANAEDAKTSAQTAKNDANVATSKANEAARSANTATSQAAAAASSATTAKEQAIISTNKATEAKNSASEARTSETAAQGYMNNTSSYKNQASASADLSKKWAIDIGSPDGATDADSSTGKTQSSRTWSLDAKAKALSASASANDALTYKNGAATSAANAFESEKNAATKATEAANSASSALFSKNSASQSATTASQSATVATNKATEASQSAESAANSASRAEAAAANTDITIHNTSPSAHPDIRELFSQYKHTVKIEPYDTQNQTVVVNFTPQPHTVTSVGSTEVPLFFYSYKVENSAKSGYDKGTLSVVKRGSQEAVEGPFDGDLVVSVTPATLITEKEVTLHFYDGFNNYHITKKVKRDNYLDIQVPRDGGSITKRFFLFDSPVDVPHRSFYIDSGPSVPRPAALPLVKISDIPWDTIKTATYWTDFIKAFAEEESVSEKYDFTGENFSKWLGSLDQEQLEGYKIYSINVFNSEDTGLISRYMYETLSNEKKDLDTLIPDCLLFSEKDGYDDMATIDRAYNPKRISPIKGIFGNDIGEIQKDYYLKINYPDYIKSNYNLPIEPPDNPEP